MSETDSSEKTVLSADQAFAGLAEAYYRGIGMPRNFNQAFKLYRKAADLGNAAALGRLGICYENGYGTDRDLAAAMTCYEDAADKGDVSAMWHLGDFYWTGVPHLVQKDTGTAANYYFDALITAEQVQDQWNAPDVFLRVADCLYHGIGTERNIKAAYDLYDSAADGFFDRIESGDMECQDDLERAESCEEACRKILGFPSESRNHN